MKTSSHPSDAKKHHSLYTVPQRRAMKGHGSNELRCNKNNGKQACYGIPINNAVGPSLVDGNS